MDYYTVNEAAKLLKLHPKTVLRKIHEGEIGSTRIGRQYRISRDQLDAFYGEPVEVLVLADVPNVHRVLASSVVDIDAISPAESSRVTNTIMAALNNELMNARVDCIYYEEVGKLKIVVHGSLERTQELLLLTQQILQHRSA